MAEENSVEEDLQHTIGNSLTDDTEVELNGRHAFPMRVSDGFPVQNAGDYLNGGEDWDELEQFGNYQQPNRQLYTVHEVLGEEEELDFAYHGSEFRGENDYDYPRNTFLTGYEDTEDSHDYEEEILPELPPTRINSEQAFFDDYLSVVPRTPQLSERLSVEALLLESCPPQPCPPEDPIHTLPRMHECPSIESFLKLGEPVCIEFTVLPGPKLFAREARLDHTILDIKKEISLICQVPVEFLELRKNNNLIMDHRSLLDVGGRPRKTLKLTVELSKRCPPNYSIKIPQEEVIQYIEPVMRDVVVHTDSGLRTIYLRIEYEGREKPYLGGYRDKCTDEIYHNAATQTDTEEKRARSIAEKSMSSSVEDMLRAETLHPEGLMLFSFSEVDFSCQPFSSTGKDVQTLKDQYQQTQRKGYYLSQQNEKFIWAKEYATAEFIERKREKAAIIIQKYWRRWLAVREREARLNALLIRVQWAENIRKGRTEIRLQVLQDELRRQHNPTTMRDVELLFRSINDWKRKELEYIEMSRWGADRKAALAQVMEMELDLLLALEKAKSKIKKSLTDKVIERAFAKMGNPSRALNRLGHFISWDTPTKFTSRQYEKLYGYLKEPVINSDERFAVLEVLYDFIKCNDSMLNKYLIDLIARELQLSKINQPVLLASVRKRIATAFYRLSRDPMFNYEGKRLEKTPFEIPKIRKDMTQCSSCRKLLPRQDFTIINGVSVSSRCLTCTGRYRHSIVRTDLNLYRYMLEELRNDEQEAGVENSVAYLIDVYDLQFLVEQLWHGQSALSGMDNKYLLRLCRWNKDTPWTPWNCLLLTEEEAVSHVKLDDMKRAYQGSFLDKVHVKHQAARIYFARLTALSIPLDPKLVDLCAANTTKKRKKKTASSRKSRITS